MTRNEYQIGDNARKEQCEGSAFGHNHGGDRGFGRVTGGEKASDFGKTILHLVSYCRGYGVSIVVAIFLAAAGAFLSIFGPAQIRNMTDLITKGLKNGIDLAAVGKIGMILIILYTLSMLFTYWQSVMMATVAQKITRKMRTSLSEKLNRLPLSYFDRESHGNILSRVTNDVDTIGTMLQQTISSLVSSITMFVGVLIIMLFISPLMTLTSIFSVCVGFSVMMLVINVSQKYFVGQQNYLGQLNGLIEETYAGHTIVTIYNNVGNAKKAFAEVNGKLYASARKAQFIAGIMMPFMSFIQNLGYVAVCVVGAVLVMSGHITFGVIIAFMLYTRQFLHPLNDLSQVGASLQSAAAAGERIFGFLDLPEQDDESTKTLSISEVTGNVSFEHVSFGYVPGKMVISDFSAVVKSGQKIAIVGPTGAGKTTLVNLLMRFYELNSGDIKIDGTSINDMKRENVRELFCMVLQDTWLFEGTIRENIVYSKKGVTDDQVKAVCRAAGIHNFIKNLPKGYDTVLGDTVNLSVGQRQLMTIARAMIQNAPMLILDEATSSVDTRTEVLIQEAMDKLMAGHTSFVIAHRLSTIRNADLILVMKDGDIIERGTHDELLALNGFYAELYNSQFEQTMDVSA